MRQRRPGQTLCRGTDRLSRIFQPHPLSERRERWTAGRFSDAASSCVNPPLPQVQLLRGWNATVRHRRSAALWLMHSSVLFLFAVNDNHVPGGNPGTSFANTFTDTRQLCSLPSPHSCQRAAAIEFWDDRMVRLCAGNLATHLPVKSQEMHELGGNERR